MEFFSGWSTALVLLFACMFYTNGLLFEKIKDDNQRCACVSRPESMGGRGVRWFCVGSHMCRGFCFAGALSLSAV